MSEARLVRLRTILGWITAACCLCAAAALIDGFAASARTGPNTYAVLAGGTESLSGPLPPEASDASVMTVVADNPAVSIDVTTQFSGFWLGGRMWRAQVRVAPEAPAGLATVTVRGRDDKSPAPAQTFLLHLFPDRKSLQAASPSLIRRAAGLPPYGAAAGFFVLALAAGGSVYLVSRRLEAIWNSQGKAVVYMTKKTPEGLVISFGLGADQGLTLGAPVTVQDDTGLTVALGTVVRCSKTDAAALVAGQGKVELGHLVRIALPVLAAS